MSTETTKIGNLTINLIQDPYPENPREAFDNLGTMVCWHRRYKLGDEQPTCNPTEFWDELDRGDHIILPLYLLDHSGITISTEPFSCPWDSGQVGWIYMPISTARENWSSLPEGELHEAAERCLRAEVEEYDAYLRGDAWGYTIEDEHGDEIESCWGFLGEECARQEAEAAARALAAMLPIQLEMSL